MIIEALSTLALSYPASVFLIQPLNQKQQTTYSALGIGMEGAYGVRPDLFATIGLDINLGARSKNVLAWGPNVGVKGYLVGGAKTSEKNPFLDSYSTPKYSVYLNGSLVQRNYNFPDNAAGTRVIEDPSLPTFERSGQFLGVSIGSGFEILTNEFVRCGLSGEMLLSAFGSTKVDVTLLTGRFSVSYQP